MKAVRSYSRQRRLKIATAGVATLVLFAIVGLSYRQWEQFRRSNVVAARARDVSESCHRVLSDMLDAETGQRGYLLTGDSRYLDPYNQAVRSLPADLATLKALLEQSPGGAESFGKLNAVVNDKLAELQQTIEVRRTRGSAPALAIVLSDRGKKRMDTIRALSREMEQSANAAGSRASAEGEAAAGTVLLAAAAGAMVLLFLFAFGLEPFASPEPLTWQRPWPMRHGAAVLAVIAVALFRAALTPLIGPTSLPFTLFFFAVAFAAWFGGFRPAVLSIALSLPIGAWFFAAPTRSFRVSGHDDQVAMLMIVVVGFAVALLTRSQSGAVERALRSENSERIQRQRFETTLASIGDAVIATDAEGRITFVNRIASALLKWPGDEAEGRALDEVFRIVNEVTRATVESPVARVLREGKIVGLANHTSLIGKDGTEVPIDDSAAPIRDADGNILGAVLVFRDVTGRRRTEKQLAEQAKLLEQAAAEARSQRQRLGLALTAGKMGVFEVDPAAKVFWWSPETYSLFGVSPAEFKPARDSFAALIHPGDKENFMQYWDENTAEFQPINHEFRILKPDGKERWISCRGTPRYDDGGSPIHYSGLFLDITERREADQVLRKFEKLSAAARLSAAIAHEINNPLSAMSNLIYLAKKAPGVPQSIAELLVQAEHELERVAHVTRQALGFYRESSRAEAIDVPELIDSVLKVLSTRIEEKKITIERDFVEGARVDGVRGEIRQVVSNLLANAIEAVQVGGTISVATHQADAGEERAVEIIVADDGHGIAPEHLDHIFEPFFSTKPGTGTGLGLWAAKEIVGRHHGSIEVQRGQSDGRGATFAVRLPSEAGGRISSAPSDPRKSARAEQDGSQRDDARKLG
ncbi:putative Histidine kinase [Candidatus Sulfotelmatomonas gaucii]|uniref:histidine kinase n=1 Tax=Candidatus Sulfuritelmatomonas gaucii TaxID=2043161 RepID=A0A2N9LUG0_9BACT|nr:putative Histidine kinase [Candidatus Sulfotelmatomonas gaucii]